MELLKNVTHLKSYNSILKIESRESMPEISIEFTKFRDDTGETYICGKFQKAYINEINEYKFSENRKKRDGLHLSLNNETECMFCDNRNPAYGSYHARCRLYNKEIYKVGNVFSSSNHDYALCCSECIKDNKVEDDNFDEDGKVFPYYIQNLKNTNHRSDIDWKDENFIQYIRTKSNTETLEKEIRFTIEEIYGESEVENKIKEYENKNVHFISKFIDMYQLSDGDFIVNRVSQQLVDAAILINEETDEYIKNYLNKGE